MNEIDNWMLELTRKLKETFGSRLLFVGLQGSYQRGEANEQSDIDAVIILDELAISDLQQYKELLAAMPHREKACGFISGKQELLNWPKQELFQFYHDTRSCHGSLEELLPPIERSDIIEGVKNGASGLYHMGCHSFLHGEPMVLKELYKGAFFVLQALFYLRSGQYISRKEQLLPLLSGAEREILAMGANWNAYQDTILAAPDRYFGTLIQWCAGVLNETF